MNFEFSYRPSKADVFVILGFVAWIFLYGGVGLDVARWQLEFFGGPATPVAVAGVYIVGALAPLIVATFVDFIRGDLDDDD